MLIREKTVNSKKIFEGKIINLRVDTIELPNQKRATREIVEHPGAVGIVPITSNQEMILVKQFRKPVDDFLLEIPAGKLEKNEEPLSCAVRELKEETGYTSANIKSLFSFYTSPGFSDEKMYLYLATDITPGPSNPDEGEYIHIESYPIAQLVDMIYRDEIKDSKTIIGIMAAKNFLGSL